MNCKYVFRIIAVACLMVVCWILMNAHGTTSHGELNLDGQRKIADLNEALFKGAQKKHEFSKSFCSTFEGLSSIKLRGRKCGVTC